MPQSQPDIQRVDTLVIGAGLIGSSVAMHLARMGVEGVRAIDFDLEGTLSSSELNAGGVRATFTQPVNIAMSKVSIEYFAQVAEEVGYRPCGYLWLHTPESLDRGLRARERQQAMGWQVDAWDVAELRRRVEFIDKVDDLAGALFAPRDGLVNPNTLKQHFRAEARKSGAQFDDRRLVRSAQSGPEGIRVVCDSFAPGVDEETKRAALTGGSAGAGAQVVYLARRVVNCAGPWAPEVARILGYRCPSQPVRRQVSIFDCRDVDLSPYGMIIDTSGVYFHPEATNGLSGFANRDEPPGFNFTYDGEAFFQERIWPALYERSSRFERLRHLTGWAGLYEVSPDESAILGEAPGLSGQDQGRIFEAHSFSGHGAMHSYAAGLALAEKMVSGRYLTIDARPLDCTRFDGGQLLHEGLVI